MDKIRKYRYLCLVGILIACFAIGIFDAEALKVLMIILSWSGVLLFCLHFMVEDFRVLHAKVEALIEGKSNGRSSAEQTEPEGATEEGSN
tara:strand:- start:16797 stop:17066 length:270 start_codon:yes stop_codon:yes gene_type:complete